MVITCISIKDVRTSATMNGIIATPGLDKIVAVSGDLHSNCIETWAFVDSVTLYLNTATLLNTEDHAT